ncbi:hypothetical protein [Geobacillus thermodenitrificans]|uniref:hypothetical protein n=2 Tax=Geobacillus thermodenitrificans TaxID=33940 RepID=UPI001E6499B6|nr:hypothetical protein [Geobacillus thermodenitrificans]
MEVPEGEQNESNAEPLKRPDLELLVMGKRVGLSFTEMNELTVNELVQFVNIYVKQETGKQKPRRRMATQADIDAFFA